MIKRYLKEFLILVYFLTGYSSYVERLSDLGITIKGGMFLVLCGICVLALLFTAYTRNHILRLFWGGALFISSVTYLSYENITAGFLTYNSFISIINAYGFAGEALQQFFYPIAHSVGISLVLLVAILIKPRGELATITHIATYTPFVVLCLLTLMLFVRGGDGGKGINSPFIPMAYANLVVYEKLSAVIGPRKPVELPRASIELSHDIVLIVDESVSPNYLDINVDNGVLSNLNKNYAGVDIFNYGYAAAITNCSYETNLTLRYGGTRDKYLSIVSTMPSIWAYAKNAGMRTVYLDAQRTSGLLQNGMTKEELRDIDQFIQYDSVPVLSRDIEVAKTLVTLINDESSDFIMVNKIGAHFPVHDKYPDDYMLYEPVLARGNYKDVTDTASKHIFSGSPHDWRLYRNSYRNTLLWNVGHFFELLLNNANMNKAAILYTSDHGQNLHEDGSSGAEMHCTSNPSMMEGAVPLVVLQGLDGEKRLSLNEHFLSNKNNSSHYNIFPTLLSLMRYEDEAISSSYGQSLETNVQDDMTFNTLYHARLGKKPTWMKVKVENIVIPQD